MSIVLARKTHREKHSFKMENEESRGRKMGWTSLDETRMKRGQPACFVKALSKYVIEPP